MNESLAHELNENIKKLLGYSTTVQPKKKSKTKQELIEEQEREIELRFMKKNLKSK